MAKLADSMKAGRHEPLLDVADLCRQLARALRNLAREITSEEREVASGVFAGLAETSRSSRVAGVIDYK